MDTYRSTQQYNALEMTPENAEVLSSWGIDTNNAMNYHAGLWAVKQADTSLIVAVVDESSFLQQFELVQTAP